MKEPRAEIDTVWRYGNRRFLAKRSAFRAMARAIMRTDHEAIESDDIEIGGFCRCDYCEDMQSGGRVLRELTAQLLKDPTSWAKT